MKNTILFLFITLMLMPMTGCGDDTDDNKDLTFVEHTNPMASNPVNTIDWLIKVKQEAKQWF